MNFWRDSAVLFRASGMMAMLLSILPIIGAVWSVWTHGIDAAFPLLLLGIAVPLVPGALALIDRSNALLPVAYGWTLSYSLPQLLRLPFHYAQMQPLDVSSFLTTYAYWMVLNTVVGFGLACWLVGNHRLSAQRKP